MQHPIDIGPSMYSMLLSTDWKRVVPLLTKKYIDDHQIVERYLADQLSDVEREEFESYYVEHPEILDDLQAAAGIKLGAASLRKSGELQKLTARRRWPSGLALAATFLVMIMGAYLLRAGAPQPVIMAAELGDFATPLTEAAIYQVQRTRSDVDAIVALPGTPQALKLRVRPALEPLPAAYRAQLAVIAEDGSQALVASLRGLQLDGDAFVTLYLNSGSLQPGNYQLNLSEDVAPEANPVVNEFLLELVASGVPSTDR
jgi:hypothetical protein